MTLPISFVYGNIVFGRRLDDAWAAFALPCSSYRWLAEEAKRARLGALVGALEAIEADFQVLRVSRAWDVAAYLSEAHTGSAGAAPEREPSEGSDGVASSGCHLSSSAASPEREPSDRRAHLERAGGERRAQATRRYLAAQAERLRERAAGEPALFLLVSLREPERDISSYVSRAAEQHPREWLRSLGRALSARDRRLL